jgi:ketol-acid reductoisomerase
MDIQATKLELIQEFLSVKKESVLEKVREVLLENSNKNEIVAYTTSGKPMNSEQYKAKIQRGLDDIENGRFTSDQDLEKEIQSW